LNNIKRYLCLVLCICLVAVSFVACQNDKEESNATSITQSNESEAPEYLVPHLGEADLDGFTLTFLAAQDRADDAYDECQFNTEEQTNEPVNDAFYNRNRKIEQEYNCKIQLLTVENATKVVEKIREAVQVGSADFQVAAAGITYLSTLATEGLLYDFNTLQDSKLNLEGDWWDQAAIRDISIADMLHFITGDIVVTDNEATWAVFFNKTIVETLDLDNPFELVRNNEWTLDKMNEMALTAKTDDGDSTRTVTGNDQWGLIAQTYDGVAYMWGAEQAMVTKDADDLPVFRLKDQTNIDVWGDVFTLLVNQDYTAMADFFYAWNSADYKIVGQNFIDGKALFRANAISTVNSAEMREAELSYGILPMPKRDANQEEYSSSCTVYWATFLTIPTVIDSSEIENTTFVLEAMAYLGKEMVTYEYYDKTLKNKRLQDTDSPDMLDLVFKNRTFDLAAIYNWGGTNGALYFYTSLIGAKSDNIVSYTDERLSIFETAMNETIEAFQENKAAE